MVQDFKSAEKLEQIEADLRESELRFGAIFNQTFRFMVIIKPDGTLIDANRTALELGGLTKSEVIGRFFWQASWWYTQQSQAIIQDAIADAAQGKRIRCQVNATASNKTISTIDLDIMPFRNETGQIVLLVAEGQIFPERKVISYVGTTEITQAEQAQALRESEAEFQAMAENAPVMIWVSGADQLRTYFNRSWLEFTGRTLEEELHSGWTQGVHPEDIAHYLETYITAFHARKPFVMEYRLKRLDSEYYWILDSGTPKWNPDGTFAGYIGSCIDISDRKQAEIALQHRAEELTRTNTILAQTTTLLKKRNDELDQFAYVASHDLKAPLRAIASLSEWLEEDLAELLPEENQHQMRLLRGRVCRMEALINGLLEYSRVGRTQTPLSMVNVTNLLKEVIEWLDPPPTFTIEVQPGMPTFLTKRLLLQQVFSNLIGNAIMHHSRSDGQVKISVQDQGQYYEFAVCDDGPGIAPEYHDKVFSIFQTLEARDHKESTGIGLAIVKKIVETEAGLITIKSQVGVGSTFSFTWLKQSLQ